MHWILAHILGDFVLQNHWMAEKKGSSSLRCFSHVLVYILPFLFCGLAPCQILLIGIQHFIQDRYGLGLMWMEFYQQSPPDKWPTGPLIIDQCLHILWIGFVTGILPNMNVGCLA